MLDYGIIYVDEVDKLRTTGANGDVNTTQVQNGLLKIVEGGEIRIEGEGGAAKFGGGGNNGGGGVVDTSNIMFVCSGAFSELNEEMRVLNLLKEAGKDIGDVNESFLRHGEDMNRDMNQYVRER